MQLSSIRAQIMFCSTYVEIKLENILFDLLSLIYNYSLYTIRNISKYSSAKINKERFIYYIIVKIVFLSNIFEHIKYFMGNKGTFSRTKDIIFFHYQLITIKARHGSHEILRML